MPVGNYFIYMKLKQIMKYVCFLLFLVKYLIKTDMYNFDILEKSMVLKDL